VSPRRHISGGAQARVSLSRGAMSSPFFARERFNNGCVKLRIAGVLRHV